VSAYTTGSPPLRPLARPFTGEAPAADDFVREERVMYLREPDLPKHPGRCVRAGLVAGPPPARRRPNATLRIEAEDGDRLYLVTEYARHARAFVAPVANPQSEPGLTPILPSGLLTIRRDAVGWHLGDATLHFDERACEAGPPTAVSTEPEARFRRVMPAAWVAFVREHRALYWVDPSGTTCERVELGFVEGNPLSSDLRWTPRGASQAVTYRVTVDADGIWLQLERPAEAGPAAPCVEHYELRGGDVFHGEILLGGSGVFGSAEACEGALPRTRPFVHHCPGVTTLPAPLPATSLAARGSLSGFMVDGQGGCEPASLDLRSSSSGPPGKPASPPLEGVFRRGNRRFEVYQWPFAERLFWSEWTPFKRVHGASWVSAELRLNGDFSLNHDLIHPTASACLAAGRAARKP
jgi:hypothetical protein